MGSLGQILIFLLPMIGIMYFLMIRPERKKQLDQQNMLASLKKGDEIVLTSGIIGRISSLDDRTVMLELADKQRIRVLKVAITGLAARFLAAPGDVKAADVKADDKKSDDKKSA